MDDNKMILTDDFGKEHVVEIILTFDDDNGNSFVIFVDPEDPELTPYAYRYDDEGNLDELQNDEQLEMCEEVLAAFMSEEEISDGEA